MIRGDSWQRRDNAVNVGLYHKGRNSDATNSGGSVLYGCKCDFHVEENDGMIIPVRHIAFGG